MIALGAVATLLWSAVLARYLGGRVASQADAPAVRV